MIKYNLKCINNHEFESWFSNSKEYEKLNKKNLLECIYCSTNKIQKTIMSPMVSVVKSKGENVNLLNRSLSSEKDKLLKLRDYVEKNFQFVGDKFSEKVREVYYDKKTQKKIYGTTTSKQREELAEEGIDLLSIPWVSKDN
tara:strand:+ start:9570 stop:9992 length:423 start_codon:yes stop_codon:yes gene_type:complete